MPRRTLAILSVLATLLSLGAFAQARPTYKGAPATFLGKPLPKKLDDCRTCHAAAASQDPSQVNARTLNFFGQRLRKVLPELRTAKKRAGISNRLEAIAEEDSDGDGASNLVELLSGRFPGDQKDVPTTEERDEGSKSIDRCRDGRSLK